ncbi:hypothetical protein ACQP3C_25715, partial [Escherichia coli]
AKAKGFYSNALGSFPGKRMALSFQSRQFFISFWSLGRSVTTLIGYNIHESFTDWLGTELNNFCTRGVWNVILVLLLQGHGTASGFSGNRVTYTYFQNLGALEQGNP